MVMKKMPVLHNKLHLLMLLIAIFFMVISYVSLNSTKLVVELLASATAQDGIN